MGPGDSLDPATDASYVTPQNWESSLKCTRFMSAAALPLFFLCGHSGPAPSLLLSSVSTPIQYPSILPFKDKERAQDPKVWTPCTSTILRFFLGSPFCNQHTMPDPSIIMTSLQIQGILYEE